MANNSTVNETVNNTVINAANQTQQNGGFNQLVDTVTGIAGGLPGGVLGLMILMVASGVLMALISLALYAWYAKRTTAKEEYEKNELSEYALPDVKNALKAGAGFERSPEPVRYNLRTKGELFADVKFSESDDLTQAMQQVQGLNVDEDSFEDLNDHLTGEDLVKEGLIDSEEKKKLLKDNDFVPHRLMAVRPDSTLGKVSWLVYDKFFDADKYTTYYLVPEVLLLDGVDHVQIPRNIQFRNFGGVEVPLYRSSMAIFTSITYRHLAEVALEDLENYSERMNHGHPEFSQDFHKMVKKMELAKELEKSGIAGDVNN